MSEPTVDPVRVHSSFLTLFRYVELTHPQHLHRCPVCEAIEAILDEAAKVRAP